MTSNEEYREFIHKLSEKIGDNARLKKLYTVANRLFVHEPVGESSGKASGYGAIIEAVYSVKDQEKLELIDRFVRRLAG